MGPATAEREERRTTPERRRKAAQQQMNVLARIDQQIADHKAPLDRFVLTLLVLALLGMLIAFFRADVSELTQFLPF
jgi:hypothetical protein